MKERKLLVSIICFFLLVPIALCADNYLLLWADTLDNGGWDGAFSVAADNSNNVIVAGCSFIGGNNDYVIVKYDMNGTMLWEDTLDNGDEDNAEAIAVDGADNIIVTGYAKLDGDYDYYTVKYDPNGGILWQDTVDNDGLYDIARGIAVDGSNNIIVTGYCDIGGDCVCLTVKYDPDGAIIWADTLAVGPYDSALGVAVDDANNIAVAGYTSDGANNDCLTAKYDSSGVLLWQETLDIREYDQAYGVAVDDAGNIIIAGCTGGAMDDYDYLIVRYDPGGALIRVDTFDNAGNDDVAYAISALTAEDVFVTGYSLPLSGTYDYYTLKCDSDGIIAWHDILDNGNDDIAHGIAIDASAGIIVTGKSFIAGDFDFLTAKYVYVPGIAERGSSRGPAGAVQWEAQPSPFRDRIHITYRFFRDRSAEPAPGQDDHGYAHQRGAHIKVFNGAGSLVENRTLYSVGSTGYTVWNGTDSGGRRLPGGVYYITFEAEGYRGTKKVLLVR